MKRVLLSILICLLFLVSCGKSEQAETQYEVYYVNKEGTTLVSSGYNPKAEKKETKKLVEELLSQMDESPDGNDMRPAKPKGVSVKEYMMEEKFLYMDFNREYSTLDAVEEVLYRAAVVKTLTQIPGVEGVSFQVGGAPLTDRRGNAIGMMTEESFVDNTGETINSFKRETLNLYFSSEDGSHLKREAVDVVYNGNVSKEKLIIEQLISGPKADGFKATLPSDVELLNIRVTDGTCYVNFDDKFQEIGAGITEDVVIYSVVDSLTEISTIHKVQISMNGKTDLVLRENRSLNKVYERNLDCVEE